MITDDDFLPDLAERPWLTRQRQLGIAILVLVLLFAVVPIVAAPDPRVQDLTRVLQSPDALHLLGTDQLGRDVLARVSAGARLTCGLALLCVLTAACIGSAAGLAAAWCGGWVNRALATVADMILAVPVLLIVLLLVAFAPGHLLPIYLALALSMWVEYFRLVRAHALRVLASPHVESARLLGFSPAYVTRWHLWPELAPYVGSVMVMGTATAVLALAAVGFVGTGLRPPTAELGLMMSESFAYWRDAPWLLLSPVAVLVAGVVGLALTTGLGEDRP